MDFTETIKMSIEDWKQHAEDEDISLSFGEVTFLSTKPNSHKNVISEDVLRDYSHTFLKKAIVAEYQDGDATTHTGDSMSVIGYIPESQEVRFSRDEEGYLQATVDVVIFKLYARDMYNVLKKDGFKSVSVEYLAGFTDETKHIVDGVEDKIVVGFEGVGVTILGKNYKPSVPTANIIMTKMSEQNFEEEYVKHSKKESIEEKILNKLEAIEEDLRIRKEQDMEEDKVLEEEIKEPVEEILEQPETIDEEVEEKVESEDVEMEELKLENESLKNQIETYKAELCSLREFKESFEKEKKLAIVEETMAKARKFVEKLDYDEAKMSEFCESGKSCKYENIGNWKNEVLANIAEFAMNNEKEEVLQEEKMEEIGIPHEEATYSLYE